MPTSTVHFRDLLHATYLRHGTHGFTFLPKEGLLRIFPPLKIRRLRPGLNSRTWVPEASTLIPRPPKPLSGTLLKLFYLRDLPHFGYSAAPHLHKCSGFFFRSSCINNNNNNNSVPLFLQGTYGPHKVSPSDTIPGECFDFIPCFALESYLFQDCSAPCYSGPATGSGTLRIPF
jgi:hypothetical protein